MILRWTISRPFTVRQLLPSRHGRSFITHFPSGDKMSLKLNLNLAQDT
jgi:hypothetical protein